MGYEASGRKAYRTERFQATPKPSLAGAVFGQAALRHARTAADERAVEAGYGYHPGLVDHFVNFCHKYCRHTQGQWEGQPFDLTAWQIENWVGPIFGWVDAEGFRRISRTYIEIPKKNYKSTFASAVGLYMLAGDGEHGAKIFSCGGTRDQAAIVHGTAIAMLERSPLADWYFVNRTTKRIYASWDPDETYYSALAAKPIAGLNIHAAICDELHEWRGDEFWQSLRYGSRARRQPLYLVITNAGDDIETVCYHQRQKAMAIANGEIVDHTFYGQVMAADRQAAEAEIRQVADGGTDLTIAASVNPALGDVIQPTALISDIRDACDIPSELGNLLRLTYGIWESAAEQKWIFEHWDDNRDDFSLQDCSELPCWLALDLARVYDFTAACLMFRDGEQYRQWPLFWLPAERVKVLGKFVPSVPVWERTGLLRVTEGAVCDYRIVLRDLVEMIDGLDCRAIIFDPKYAEEFTQELAEQTGLDRVSFAQSHTNYHAATDEYERQIILKNMRHDGNPILRWMASNAICDTNIRGHKMPRKRNSNSYDGVDGIQAAIMALSQAMQYEPEAFVVVL